MTSRSLISRYNNFNGKPVSLTSLKDFHAQVQKHLDSDGHGSHATDLKGIYERVGKAIKQMITSKLKEVEADIEVVKIKSQSSDGCKELELPLSDIHTDTKRFQNRVDAFSEASAESVANNYNPNKFDPIVVWQDPKAKKTFVLSGHSRYEGMKRRKAKSIPIRYFKGNEEAAIKFARVEANRAANQESLIEDLAAYRLMRDGEKAFDIKPTKKHKGPFNKLQMAQLQDAIKAGRTPKVNLKAKLNAKQKPAPLFDELEKNDPKQTSLFGVVDANKLAKVKFYSHNLGPFKNELFKVNSDTNCMIWGLPGHGKTVKLLKMAQHFAETGKKVLYIAEEEFGKSTFAEKLTDFKIGHKNLSFACELVNLSKFEIVFFDSVNSLKLTPDKVKDLDKKYPNKTFFLIVQTTKDGNFRGGQDWEHLVDIAGEIHNRKLILRKNRLDPNNSSKAEKLHTADAITEAKKKQTIREAVKVTNHYQKQLKQKTLCNI